MTEIVTRSLYKKSEMNLIHQKAWPPGEVASRTYQNLENILL